MTTAFSILIIAAVGVIIALWQFGSASLLERAACWLWEQAAAKRARDARYAAANARRSAELVRAWGVVE